MLDTVYATQLCSTSIQISTACHLIAIRHETNTIDHCTWYEPLTIDIIYIIGPILRHTLISYSCLTDIYMYHSRILVAPTALLHRLTAQVHMHMLFLSSCHMDHSASYMYYCAMLPYHVIWLFPVIDMDIPVTGHESCWYAICGLPHLLIPLYYSRYIVPDILFPIPVILFYAINRALVQLLC